MESWYGLIVDPNASRFIRSLIRLIVGLPRKATNEESVIPKDTKLWKQKVKDLTANSQLKQSFRSFAELAMNYRTMKRELSICIAKKCYCVRGKNSGRCQKVET